MTCTRRSDLFNAAIARRTGVTTTINKAVRIIRRTDPSSVSDLEALRRLPFISAADADALLGGAGDHLLDPAGLKDLVHVDPDSVTTTTTEPPTTTAPEEPTTVP